MGGRGSTSSFAGRNTGTGTLFRQMVTNAQQMQPTMQAQLPPQQQVQNQQPTPQNTPVVPGAVTALSQMDDDQLAQLVQLAKNVSMPNHLSDADDLTQKFIYAAGINAKPTTMDSASFNQFLQQNNIPRSDILARSVNGASYTVGNTRYNLTAQQVINMFTSSRLTYSGGKQGGQAYGGGTYFAKTGGANTGYGGTTMMGVLNPATARVITANTLRTKAQQFAATHPKFARAVGPYTGGSWGGGKNNMSIYALAMGYNVINDGSSGSGAYYNVIDRSAMVISV